MSKNTQQREFKGVWIPADIWLAGTLTWMEKLFLTEIDSLDNDERGCFASNDYLAGFFSLSTVRTSQIINSLVRKGVLSSTIDASRGNQRSLRLLKESLRPLLKKPLRPSQRKVYDPIKETFKNNNIENSKENEVEEARPARHPTSAASGSDSKNKPLQPVIETSVAHAITQTTKAHAQATTNAPAPVSAWVGDVAGLEAALAELANVTGQHGSPPFVPNVHQQSGLQECLNAVGWHPVAWRESCEYWRNCGAERRTFGKLLTNYRKNKLLPAACNSTNDNGNGHTADVTPNPRADCVACHGRGVKTITRNGKSAVVRCKH